MKLTITTHMDAPDCRHGCRFMAKWKSECGLSGESYFGWQSTRSTINEWAEHQYMLSRKVRPGVNGCERTWNVEVPDAM